MGYAYIHHVSSVENYQVFDLHASESLALSNLEEYLNYHLLK